MNIPKEIRLLILSMLLSLPIAGIALGESSRKLPLRIIENRGQLDGEVEYYIEGLEQNVFFTKGGVLFSLKNDGREGAGRYAVRLDFEGADRSSRPHGLERLPGELNYFRGPAAQWKTRIPSFCRLIYKDLWPGIDLIYSAGQDRLKYEFLLRPGADPGAIRMAYNGIDALRIKDDGALDIVTTAGTISDEAPVAYQPDGDRRIPCALSFTRPERKDDGAWTVGFDVGPHDPNRELILDPAILVYCGYLGGISTDTGTAVAADAEGNTYITGFTLSTESSFPVTQGPDLTYSADWDIFVAKISADGTQLVYCGYIGGAGHERGPGIAVGADGAAYIAGITGSSQSTFPVKVGPDLTINGGQDAFVAKVNPTGTDLDFCGYLGGAGDELGDHCGIALDDAGDIYMSCITELYEPANSTQSSPGRTLDTGYDVYYAKVSADGTTRLFQGAIMGDDLDIPTDLDVDPQGNLYIAGRTFSSESEHFPVTVGPDLTFNGGETDNFVTKINADGATVDYCGYIGGGSIDDLLGLVVDDEGHAYVTGFTLSDESTFPVVVGPCLTSKGKREAFVAKVSADGAGLDYCGFIGGANADEGRGVDLDEEGNLWVAGYTSSDESTFPVSGGPGVVYKGNIDVFVSRVNASGTELDYSGYIGGFGSEFPNDICVDAHGAVHIVGDTSSDDAALPLLQGPDLSYNGGLQDVLVSKFIVAPGLTADVATLSASTGGTIHFEIFAGLANASRKYLLLGGVSGSDPGTLLPRGFVTLPLNWDIYTDLVVSLLNTSIFMDFYSDLDLTGRGYPVLNAPVLPSTGIGLTMVYAGCLKYPWQYVTESVEIQIMP